MTIFRSVANKLRREDYDQHELVDPNTSMMSRLHVQHTQSSGYLASKFASMHQAEESPDMYYEDRELGSAIRALEDVRASLRNLTDAANEHKDMLCAAGTSQRNLGEQLTEALESHDSSDRWNDSAVTEHADSFADLDTGANGPSRDESDAATPQNTIAKFLSDEAIEAQRVLGQSFVAQASAMIKLGIALSNPINELQTSFEERFSRKIVPLRRRYVDQKGQYLKYMRQSDAAEEDEKRSYYDALAQAAKPVWVRTSKELRMEAHVMTEMTSRNIARWSKTLALQHERSLAIAAANFSEAITRAKGR